MWKARQNRCRIHPSQSGGDLLDVLIRDVADVVPDLMHDTLPDLRLWERGGNAPGEARQVVHAGDQDVTDAPVLHLREDAKPELGRFAFPDPDADDLFYPFQI